MRKIISFMHASLDGYVSDPKAPFPGLDFVSYDSELEADAHSLHATTDVAIHGRVTYQMMEGYWPTVLQEANPDPSALAHARWLQDSLKIVVSHTLNPEDVTWENTRLIKDDLAGAFTALKQQPGKDMVIFGSPGLVKSLAKLDLIDEYRVNVNPIILGGGIPLFGSLDQSLKLRLVRNKQFGSGVVGLLYERVRE